MIFVILKKEEKLMHGTGNKQGSSPYAPHIPVPPTQPPSNPAVYLGPPPSRPPPSPLTSNHTVKHVVIGSQPSYIPTQPPFGYSSSPTNFPTPPFTTSTTHHYHTNDHYPIVRPSYNGGRATSCGSMASSCLAIIVAVAILALLIISLSNGFYY